MSTSPPYKVLVEKEYNPLPTNRPSLALLMMVKNEHLRIEVTLNSIIGTVDAMIIFDTGSTDNTVEIITTFAEKNKINLYLIQGGFVDFATSRNVSLEYAEKIGVDFLILLDCNDELRNGRQLYPFLIEMKEQNSSAFLVLQHWWSGTNDRYWNVRLIKNREGWRYKGIVHEYMSDTKSSNGDPRFPVLRAPESVVIYQDRTKDDDKTGKRFFRDKELLLQEYKKNPTDTRTLFYLGQTCSCLNQPEDALFFAKLRLELGGFEEERFHSFMRCGLSAAMLGQSWDDVLPWFIKAYEHSARAEPLCKLADYYRYRKLWHLSYMFAITACQLPYPTHLILFVDNGQYDYYRWHLLADVAHQVQKYEEGKWACLKAIEQGGKKKEDVDNLKFYEGKTNVIDSLPPVEHNTRATASIGGFVPRSSDKPVTKAEFFTKHAEEVKEKFPRITQKQLDTKLNLLWKKTKKETA